MLRQMLAHDGGLRMPLKALNFKEAGGEQAGGVLIKARRTRPNMRRYRSTIMFET